MIKITGDEFSGTTLRARNDIVIKPADLRQECKIQTELISDRSAKIYNKSAKICNESAKI